MSNNINDNYILLPTSETDDIEVLEFNLVANEKFRLYWCSLARILGFQFSNNIKDLNISKSNDGYILHEGSTAEEGSFQILVSKFKLEFIPDTITLGKSTKTNLMPDTFGSTTLNNKNNISVKNTKDFNFKVGNKVSVNSSHKIANSLSIKKSSKVNIGAVTGSLGLNFKFSHQYSFGNQESILKFTQFVDQATFTVPPNSSLPVNVIFEKEKIKTSFVALVRMFYNITFKGPLDTSKNTHKNFIDSNSKIKQVVYTFGNDKYAAYEHLKKQYNLRNLQTISAWDWELIVNENNAETLNFLFDLFKGFAIQINGSFQQENSVNISISAGPPLPYSSV